MFFLFQILALAEDECKEKDTGNFIKIEKYIAYP